MGALEKPHWCGSLLPGICCTFLKRGANNAFCCIPPRKAHLAESSLRRLWCIPRHHSSPPGSSTRNYPFWKPLLLSLSQLHGAVQSWRALMCFKDNSKNSLRAGASIYTQRDQQNASRAIWWVTSSSPPSSHCYDTTPISILRRLSTLRFTCYLFKLAGGDTPACFPPTFRNIFKNTWTQTFSESWLEKTPAWEISSGNKSRRRKGSSEKWQESPLLPLRQSWAS